MPGKWVDPDLYADHAHQRVRHHPDCDSRRQGEMMDRNELRDSILSVLKKDGLATASTNYTSTIVAIMELIDKYEEDTDRDKTNPTEKLADRPIMLSELVQVVRAVYLESSSDDPTDAPFGLLVGHLTSLRDKT